jgi:hypothetical protein
MSLLAGIDLSTKRLDAALIPADAEDTTVPPVVFRRFDLPRMPTGCTAQHRSVERLRDVHDGMRELLRDIRDPSKSYFDQLWWVSSVWVEEPFGPRNKATNALREVYGGILASIPPHIERAAIAPREWRRTLGLDPTKDASIRSARRWLDERHVTSSCDEHQAEALLIALAGRELTWRAVEGAA